MVAAGFAASPETIDATGITDGRPLGNRMKSALAFAAALVGASFCLERSFAQGGAQIQSELNQANAGGGATIPLPTANYLVSSPIDIVKGGYLQGQCPGGAPDTQQPYLECSAIRPGGTNRSLASLIAQSSLASPVVASGLSDLLIDGCKSQTGQCPSSYSVANLVQISPVGHYFERSFIGNGSGNCVYYKTNPIADWINWFDRNSITNCSGIGLDWEASDSVVLANYISNNNIAALFNNTGTRVALNQFEGSASDGVQVKNLLSVGFPGTDDVLLGNLFALNGQSDIHFMVGAGASHTMRGPVVANNIGSSGVLVDNNVTDGLFVGNAHSGETLGYDVKFGGVGNSGWQFIGMSSSVSPQSRFVNLPDDAQVISGGPGGPWNRLMNLILGSGVTTTDATLNVYGCTSVLGSGCAQARFGVAREASGIDAALIVGVNNGNGPFIDAANGETTTAASFALEFNSAQIVLLNATSAIFNRPIYYAGPLPTGTPATYACFSASGELISSPRPC